jgi:preprotein translocase subunit SecY
MVITMTAGTGVIMWLGELITDRGVGNGMSILIFTSIAARLPGEGWTIKERAASASSSRVVIVGPGHRAVVFIEQAQRRIPVQYAKRMVGRRMYGGTSTYIPLKVNQAGVIPVIFASSLLYLPQLVACSSSTRQPQGLGPDWISDTWLPPDHWLYIARTSC